MSQRQRRLSLLGGTTGGLYHGRFMRPVHATSWLVVLGVCVCLSLTSQGRGDPTTRPAGGPEYLVGIHYFAGWWRGLPNKWHVAGQDWRQDWPARVPTLGEYNEQATMDREIEAAADHGVDFFQILYYCLPRRTTARAACRATQRRTRSVHEVAERPPAKIHHRMGQSSAVRQAQRCRMGRRLPDLGGGNEASQLPAHR